MKTRTVIVMVAGQNTQTQSSESPKIPKPEMPRAKKTKVLKYARLN